MRHWECMSQERGEIGIRCSGIGQLLACQWWPRDGPNDDLKRSCTVWYARSCFHFSRRRLRNWLRNTFGIPFTGSYDIGFSVGRRDGISAEKGLSYPVDTVSYCIVMVLLGVLAFSILVSSRINILVCDWQDSKVAFDVAFSGTELEWTSKKHTLDS